ncbi:hypothetical protein BDV19DRAFT_378022 [Aspergillus venezuelensis]
MVSPAVASRWASRGLVLLQLGQLAAAFRTTPGSPCESSCSPTNDTLPSEVVCLDNDFSNTDTGRRFKECISCQLESTFTDDISHESDVEWGLYNLRFAFSSCVYGYPEKVADISNPCPVACEDLESPIEFQLANPSGENLETWCDTASFADNEVSDCGKCYNLTRTTRADGAGSQVYMANFLESLRYNCHFQTPTEEEFPITPARIFTESLLPSSTADLISGSGGTDNLALIIAMPILGFVILCCLLALGCFFFIRSRRKKARRLRQPGHLHARWNDTGISTPQWAMEYHAQAQGMHSMYNNPAMYSPQVMYNSPQPEFAQYTPGMGSGFGFVDSDGRGQEVGYSYSSSKVPEPVIASPSTVYSPEEKGQQTHQMYFPPPPQPGSGNGKMRQTD